LATVDDAGEAGLVAREEAEQQLLERGYDLTQYPRLLTGLQHAVEQVVAANELHRDDIADYRSCLDEAYELLDAEPVVDRMPRPPKRTLRMSW
jgi:hypothetical protein